MRDVELHWMGPWPLRQARHLRELSFRGVYLWIWPGRPDRIRYVGESGNVWKRVSDELDDYERGWFSQFNPPADDHDFFMFFAKYRHDRKHVRPGIDAKRRETPDDEMLRWARASLSNMTCCFAKVADKNLPTKAVETRLIEDTRDFFARLTGVVLRNDDPIPFPARTLGFRDEASELRLIHKNLGLRGKDLFGEK